jgi:GNAT superfamily N-acetyltransferase
MNLTYRTLMPADAEIASALVHRSFTELAARDWKPRACAVFLDESSPARMRTALESPAFAAGAFSDDAALTGLVLMRRPAVLDMLFVHPHWVRRGIGRHLWERARSHLEVTFEAVKTVELNATPCAVVFYRSLGFAPISAEFVRGGCRATRMACWLPARALGAMPPGSVPA